MDKQCVHCGNPFQTKHSEQRFCGKACAISARHAAKPDKRVEMTCPVCGKRRMGLPSQLKGYCSRQCVTAAQRNQRRADKAGEPLWDVRPDGCWQWRGGKAKGYPMHRHGGIGISAHRWSYEQHIGPIPKGCHVHHRCENSRCVNPAHLEARQPTRHLREHKRKLTDEQVAVIRSSSEPGKILASAFGVSQASISAIRKGNSYRG
jgi:hypothetical protein